MPNPTNASSSFQPLDYPLFLEFTKDNEQFAKLINELTKEDKQTNFHLLQHCTYLEFANMFEEDHAELH
jgi:hypothetical protein